jgi:hypothetical protein
VPAATAVGAFAAMVALAVAFPIGAVLSVLPMSGDGVDPPVVMLTVAVAYVAAVVAGARRLSARRSRGATP